MKHSENPSLETQKGQGEPRKVSDEMFKAVKSGLNQVADKRNRDIWRRRAYSDRTRFCLWAGQHPDGRKHDSSEESASPFDGASDARVRLADMILNMQVAMCKAACKRGNLTIRGLAGEDHRIAEAVQTLARHVLNNRIGHEWRLEIERFFQWSLGDSPAVALMHVGWQRESRVRMREFGVIDLVEYLVEQGVPFDEEAAANLESLITNPEREEELISAILERFPELKPATVKKSLKRLREEGETEFPESYAFLNDAVVEAHRMWEDVFVPVNTRSPRKCTMIYRRCWYTLADIVQKGESGEWSKKFVEDLKNFEAKTKMPEQVSVGTNVSEHTHRWNQESEHEGMYEVWHVYLRAANEDGHQGIYTLPFSCYVEEPGAEMTLLDYPHGDFPYVWHVREAVTRNLLDARGVSELVISDQNFLKSLRDLTSDHAQIYSLRPHVTDSRMTKKDVTWKALGIMKIRRSESFKPIEMSDMPRSNVESQARILQGVSQYFGIPLAEINGLLQNLLTQDLVDDALDAAKGIVTQIIQLTIKYKDADEIRLLTDSPELDVEALRLNIHRLDDMTISFDPQVFSIEYLEAMAKIMRDFIMAMDREQTLEAHQIVDFFVRALMPGLGDKFLRPVDSANMAEANEEKINYALIKAGVEPEMAEDGQNFALRLQTLQEIVESNPESVAEMSDTSKQILAARVEHLSNQVQQGQNAVIGRQMGREVLQ